MNTNHKRTNTPDRNLTCPYCKNGLKIRHILAGVWTINVDNPSCNACLRAIQRISKFCDENDDETIIRLLMNGPDETHT